LKNEGREVEMKTLVRDSSPNIKKENSQKNTNNHNYTLQNENYIEESVNEKKKGEAHNNFNHLSDSDEEINQSNKNSTNKTKFKNKESSVSGNTIPAVELNNIDLFHISEPNESDNLFDIFYKLKHNTNLNILIKTINKILVNEHKKPFDKSDLTIVLGAKELDKFNKIKKINQNFAVSISYSLYE
jgi:hypothetical protein